MGRKEQPVTVTVVNPLTPERERAMHESLMRLTVHQVVVEMLAEQQATLPATNQEGEQQILDRPIVAQEGGR